MDAEERPDGAALAAALVREAPHYSFFQLVQLVERYAGARARVGREGPAGDESIRFRPWKSLAFQSSDVIHVETAQDERGRDRWIIETSFLGLYGTSSPLPSYYTEELLHESGDESLVQGFLDLFNHRLISLFYRCFEKYRFYTQFRGEGTDEYSHRMLCLLGLGTAPYPADAAVPRVRLLRYGGMLLERSRPPEALRAFLFDYFDGLPVRVEPFAARWMNIPPDQRNRLGSANCSLGMDLHAGEQVMDRAGKFRIVVGPVGLATFLEFLPHRVNFKAVDEIVRLMVIDQLEYDVEVILRREEIPNLRLAADSDGAWLGQTTWLGRPSEDAHVVFQPSRRGVAGASGSQDERRSAAAAA